MESPCECGIEPPGTISHGVSSKTACNHAFSEDFSGEKEFGNPRSENRYVLVGLPVGTVTAGSEELVLLGELSGRWGLSLLSVAPAAVGVDAVCW